MIEVGPGLAKDTDATVDQAQLYLAGFGLELADLEASRTWDSATPGHPEHHHIRDARSHHHSGTRSCWLIAVTRVEETWAGAGSAVMKNVSTSASSWFMRAIGIS